MRLFSLILGTSPLILAIISFTFTVLSTTSKQWAYQDFYSEDGSAVSLDQQINPLWTIYRSPFWTCGRPADAKPGDYSTKCTRHSLTSFGHRACETLVHTNLTFGPNDPAYGDPRQCQQIHMAASLTVSSSVFSGLALLSLLVLVALSFLSPKQHHSRHHAEKASPIQFLNIWIVLCLLLSAGLLVLAQFYGVLGLVQSALPNGEYATNQAISTSSGPWIQGKANVIYASTGWFAGVLTAAGCLLVWGVPAVGSGEGVDREKRGDVQARED